MLPTLCTTLALDGGLKTIEVADLSANKIDSPAVIVDFKDFKMAASLKSTDFVMVPLTQQEAAKTTDRVVAAFAKKKNIKEL
ncbi:hypothetical protein Tco_1009993 [Tanacetum coccineum]